MNSHLISVIIPTRNRSVSLSDTIESIFQNNFSLRQFEVLVIDNGSTDDTKIKCLAFEKKYSNLKYFYEEKNGLHYGRHKGLMESKGEILIYIDDDVIVSQNWLMSYLETFKKDSKIVLAGGNDLPRFEGEVPEWVDSLWKQNQYGKYLSEYSLIEFNIPAQEIPPQYIYGCNFAVRKEFLLLCKGFHPDGFSKENILRRGDGETFVSNQVSNLKFKSYFHPDAYVYHRIPSERLTQDYMKSRYFSQGVTFSYVNLRKKTRLSFINYVLMMLNYRICRIRASLIRTLLFRKLNLAFYDGAIMHLKAYNRDQSLQEWVHKESYL